MRGSLAPRARAGQRRENLGMADNSDADVEVDNMPRLERIVARLPEAERVDIEAWGGEPTFRVRGKNFVFTDPQARNLSVKLPKDEAAAVVATESSASPTGYGLGRHGWVSVEVGDDAGEARWQQVEE